MNQNEMQLLAALRKDARTSLLALSKELNMPASTVHDKVRRYNGSIVLKHTSLLDFKKLGFERACLAVRTTPSGRQRVQEYLSKHPKLNNLHKVDSGFDFLAEIVANDQKDVEDFISALKLVMGVLEIQKFTIIEDLKREEFGFYQHDIK